MKTNLYLLITFLCLTISIKAQLPCTVQPINKYKAIDSLNYEFTYSFKFLTDSTKPKQVTEDLLQLQIGSKCSKVFSLILLKSDSTAADCIKKGMKNYIDNAYITSTEDIYKNYPKGKITVSYRTFDRGPIFKYEEDLNLFTWKILSEKKDILSIPCQKATTTFRGRQYTAWFAPSIPYSDGPWKFNGLPGLILEINEDNGNFKYQCIGIHKMKEVKTIKFWDWKYKKINRKKLQPFIKRMYENPNAFLQTVLGVPINVRRGKTIVNPNSLKYPYNPIELE